jgi:glycosyltransferase involved in cell wall biosynthesis
VFSGQPYPELDPGVTLTKVPSLDLYREPDPFRFVWRPSEYRDMIDVQESAIMWTAGFPEPRTFSKRVARLLKDRLGDFDVVHDNQTLGYGVLDLERMGFPLVTTIHHPITFDRRIDLKAAPLRKKFSVMRWYGFLKMQAKVASQLKHILTVSENSRIDIAKDFNVDPELLNVIPLGADDVFVPPTKPRVPGRIVAMASADAPMKGIAFLLEAFAKLRTERDVELLLITKPKAGGQTEKLIERLSIGDSVRFINGISDAELAEIVASAEIACVPSLYEGFSLPTAEAMACATPLVVSRAGAIPEVVGPDGLCADLVTPGDVGELTIALENLLDDPERRERMGRAGRQRVEDLFSWRAVAVATAEAYERAVADKLGTPAREMEKADA